LNHASRQCLHNKKLKLELILSDKLDEENVEKKLGKLDGIIVAPGFGQRGMEGKFVALNIPANITSRVWEFAWECNYVG